MGAILLWAGVAGAWGQAAGDPAAYALLEDLERGRSDHDAAVRGGRVEGYRLVVITKQPEAALPRSVVTEELLPVLMGMTPGLGGREDLDARTSALVAKHVPDPDQVVAQWSWFSLVYSGDDLAVRTEGLGGPELMVWTGGEEHLYTQNADRTWGQVSLLSQPRGVRPATPHSFLFLPDNRKVPRLRLETADGVRTLTNDYYTMALDGNRHILRETLIRSGGQYWSERFQRDFRDVPLAQKTLSLPHSIASLDYARIVGDAPAPAAGPLPPDDAGDAEDDAAAEGPRVAVMTLHRVIDAEFGVEAGPEAFRIAAPQGTTVADFRGAERVNGTRRAWVGRLREGTADVVEAVRSGRVTLRQRWRPRACGLYGR
ncbi:hypothetical protein [Alienimonas chondri]|uniref:MucB/RseB N-terminal domain-containing protein n=1 Tax=Alienimonas chondri TaxID=2681879 RepID=A0ABX1VIK9_9PLAN|nr:hypothetical protein [Alienimonas chondri]NNJ27276.1 hypothetical protein [Alienimonas chondri]